MSTPEKMAERLEGRNTRAFESLFTSRKATFTIVGRGKYDNWNLIQQQSSLCQRTGSGILPLPPMFTRLQQASSVLVTRQASCSWSVESMTLIEYFDIR